MSPARREVLKMMAAGPLIGMFGASCARTTPAAHNPQAARGPRAARMKKGGNEIVWREFDDSFLSQIAFPLGGIGTGTVSLGGRGNLRDWEIANNPDKGRRLENTFFALWYRDEHDEGRACILESQLTPPFEGWMGLARDGMPGMPRFEKGLFHGAYPFARLDLTDPEIPIEATLEAFNPFIPMNDKDSGLPVAIFYWRLRNKTRRAIPVTVLAAQLNIAGNKSFGKNLNSFSDDGVIRGLKMTTAKHDSDKPNFGSLALVTPHQDVTYQTRWARSGWFDDQSLFWNDFVDDGKLERPFEEGPTPDNRTDTGCLGLRSTLKPGESQIFPFILAWHFPNRENNWNGEKEVKGKILKNYYATLFGDAWAAAAYTLQNLERLERESREFQEALFNSSLPPIVLDAVSSQAAIIKTNVCFRTEDGNFYGFEGTSDNAGCCPLNCTHVWNYEQALAHLFPALERRMRQVDFGHNTLPEGNMAFRTLVPLGDYHWNSKLPAADGQMGTVIKLYREWRLSGDTEFLRSLWPDAKRALEYAWKNWDKDKDGIMEGIQHNTYDIEFHGPNPMMGAIYLAALLAGEEMAKAMGEADSAADYRRVYEMGRKTLDAELWKGEFYVQKYDKAKETKYQLGEGCLSDQLLGQWMAHVNGLGYVLPEERVKTAIGSVYRYNWKPTMERHYNPQRIYALGDEAGLLLCSWPKGGRPPLPFVYSDEVWTGIEYQVAAHLIYEGMIDEGLNIVKGVRNRYDGQRRNPWDEIECGHHYSRAMASWSLLLALSGFHFHGPEATISFAPVINAEQFNSFWSCGQGWGTYRQTLKRSNLRADLEVKYGEVKLAKLRLPAPHGAKEGKKIAVVGRLAGKSIQAEGEIKSGRLIVSLPERVTIAGGATLSLEAHS